MKHSCDQPVHTYFPSARVGTIHLYLLVEHQEFSPFSMEGMNVQSTNMQAILIHKKRSCTRGNLGEKDPWVREEREVQNHGI